MSALYEQMKSTAQKNAQKTAIVFYGKRYSFQKVLSLVDKAAEGLKQAGVKKGSVVTLCVLNTPSAFIAFYALNRLGAVINLVHPFVAAEGLADSVKKTNSSLLIVYDLFLRDKGAELKERLDRAGQNATVLLSRSDFFMNAPSRLYFKLFQQHRPSKKKRADRLTERRTDRQAEKTENAEGGSAKAKKQRYDVFESLFKNTEIADSPAVFDQNQPAVYLPSGGTAGVPKTIMHREGVFNELCSMAQFFLAEPVENYTAMYSVLPIFHGFGLCMSMHMCAVYGLKNVMSIKFVPKSVAKAIPKERVNVIMGVPAMFARLLDCPQFLKADLSSIKEGFIGGDAAPKRLVDGFNAALKKSGGEGRLYVGYGLTETVAVCAVNCSSYYKEGSAGYPLPVTRLAVIKDGKRALPQQTGEIAIKTPLVMLDYLENHLKKHTDADKYGNPPPDEGDNKLPPADKGGNLPPDEGDNKLPPADKYGNPPPDEGDSKLPPADKGDNPPPDEGDSKLPPADKGGNLPSADEASQSIGDDSPFKDFEGEKWLFTGDLGYLDDDGFLFFKQRVKNMIKVKGVPVYPCEIEAVAEGLPWVVRACAVGVLDKAAGEVVKLYVEAPVKEIKRFFGGETTQETLKSIIIEECEKRLIRYAVPKIIEIREALPLNQIGKVDRKKLD